jgi:sugar phosphate isomerase/epimerase
MKLAFATLGCPDWSLDDIMARGKGFGFDGVELRTHADGNHFSPEQLPAEARATGARFRDAGLPVISVMGYATFAHLDQETVRKNAELLLKLVDLAEAFGAPYVRTFAGRIRGGADRETMVRTVAGAIRPAARRAADKGVRIGIETHDHWCSGDHAMQVVQAVDSPGFGVVYDICNSFLSGIETWEATYDRIRRHICYCQLKDGYRATDGGEVANVMVGAGDLPLRPILARLKADGFAGFLSFEWEKKWHPELEPPERAFPQFVHKVRSEWAAI